MATEPTRGSPRGCGHDDRDHDLSALAIVAETHGLIAPGEDPGSVLVVLATGIRMAIVEPDIARRIASTVEQDERDEATAAASSIARVWAVASEQLHRRNRS